MSAINDSLTKLLSPFPEIKLAILFGYQATGMVTEESYIDLALLIGCATVGQF